MHAHDFLHRTLFVLYSYIAFVTAVLGRIEQRSMDIVRLEGNLDLFVGREQSIDFCDFYL